MVLSRWPYPPGRERATLSRCLTSSGVRYSRGRTAALVGRRGVIVRFSMVGPFLRFTRNVNLIASGLFCTFGAAHAQADQGQNLDAHIGFQGGRAEGEDRGAGRLRIGVPVSRGAIHAHADLGEPAIADRRREVLRAGAPAPLAGGRALPVLPQRLGRPPRSGRHPAVPAALPLRGVRRPLRRSHGHGVGRPPPAAAGLGAVPLLHGPEPLQPADRPGAGPLRPGRAAHDRAAAARPGGQDPRGDPGRRGGDRRGLRCGRPQGPAGRRRQRGRLGRRRRLAGAPGRGTLAKDKPPVLGLVQRGGQVVLRMLANVRQKTIGPIIGAAVARNTLVYTDEYDIYARLEEWGYGHKTVCHARGEYARDEDGDGFCEVHVNTMEGVWSLLRSWLRPRRGVSQEKLPLYLAFFQFVHNARCRGKALLGELVTALVA